MTFLALHGRRVLRHFWNHWKLRREARALEEGCVQIIALRRRQRLLATMLDGWRRAAETDVASSSETPAVNRGDDGANDVTTIAAPAGRRSGTTAGAAGGAAAAVVETEVSDDCLLYTSPSPRDRG